MHASVCDLIAEIFAGKLNRPVAGPDTDLFETAVLDSLAFVDLLMHLEEACGIRIEPEDFDLDRFRSISRIAAFVAERQARLPGPAATAASAHG
jgi:acyl carrier protein